MRHHPKRRLRKVTQKIGLEQLDFIVANQPYPEAMQENEEFFKPALSGDFSWGLFLGEKLVGWVLFTVETKETLYCEDFVILPEFQGLGLGKKLWREAVREVRWLNLAIHVHCRKQSYPLIRATEGYKVAMDLFHRDWYLEEYNDPSLKGEDCRELLLVIQP